MLQKTNIEGFYKDSKTNMVINLSNEYEIIKAQRKKDKDLENMKNEINNLKKDIQDIKSLLIELLRNNTNG